MWLGIIFMRNTKVKMTFHDPQKGPDYFSHLYKCEKWFGRRLFPGLGETAAKSSKVWENRREIFQCLEKRGSPFPSLGKRGAD
jgi:hypothetical protein